MKDLLDDLPEIDDVEGSPASLAHLPTTDPYEGLSKLGKTLTTAQRDVLLRDVTADELDILPGGEVYLTQSRYRRRLVEAFGPGGWGMRPLGALTMKDNVLFREWSLVVDGRVVASAVGKAEYIESGRTDIADAAETVKSNALMRTCKDLGIAWQCWDKRFTQQYRRERCVQVRVVKKYGKGAGQAELQWRRTDADPIDGEQPPPAAGQPATVDVQSATTPRPDVRAPAFVDAPGKVVDVTPVPTTALTTKAKAAAVVLYPSDVFAEGQAAGWTTKALNALITERLGKAITQLAPGAECARAIALVREVRAQGGLP